MKIRRPIHFFKLAPWDTHIIELEVGPHSDFVDKTLEELSWREKFGINVAYIKRGNKVHYTPTRESKLFPYDLAGIIANDEQMQIFEKEFNAPEKSDYTENSDPEIILQNIQVNDLNRLKGLTIKDSAIREKTNGLVLGIERNKDRILNPVSSTILEWGDIVWIVGEREKIDALMHGSL